MVPIVFLKSFCVAKLLMFVHGVLRGLLDCLFDWMGEPAIGSPYYFKYCLSNQVFNMEGVPMSTAKADSFSPELMREAIPSSVSLVETLTTLLEDALAFPLDFLFVMIVHCWVSMRSG